MASVHELKMTSRPPQRSSITTKLLLSVLSLEILQGVMPSFEIANNLEVFLASGFNWIPWPSLGPTSFKNFWTTAYRMFDFVEHPYPENLKPILRTVQELLRESEEVFAHGLSQLMDMQLLETVNF
ncbi:hypothetical protein M422DRAFT_271653 [Sphaerobolus stellatus SS14]|uniref:Uncharacterized protein n=1 Tax=Sphaerobolus stellatus (strain SS14) TaxID=990650 RepID=A0A0C9UDQ9_SPHS4|nr:hypothetical protein M422DRAFT_271653 [Sphaerobolus stellatus SS14]